ncbi:cation diffusion facilitator family transporter [Halalkalibacillus halophilus]|uniref:cation diffusion facilitator family transporter n=1 Tax=Halalkalibacillus halophilus TaxID=392827 RepID=UPI000482393B|nr:cation transporter [Halalkalibacillus halophilus]
MVSENRLLMISIWGAVLFSITGVALGLISSSQMVLFDGLYSFISVGLSLMSLLAARFINKKDPVRFPYGKQMIEPLVIIVKYAAIIMLCLGALFSAVDALISGGRETAIGIATAYAFFATVACFGYFRYLNSKAGQSGFVKAEANQWRMDSILSAAVFAGFIIALILQTVGVDRLIPYVDPLMVVMASVYFLKVPLLGMVDAFKEVLDMAPHEGIQSDVSQAIESVVNNSVAIDYQLRVSKVGAVLFIEMDVLVDGETSFSIQQQDRFRRRLEDTLSQRGHQHWLTVSFTADRDRLLDS